MDDINPPLAGQLPLFPALPIYTPRAWIKPLVRFPGGKSWILPVLSRGIWLKMHRTPNAKFHEPFAGGAAAALNLGWPATVLGDASPDLITCYRAVRDDPKRVIEALAVLIGSTPDDDVQEQIVGVTKKGQPKIKRTAPAYYQARSLYNDGVRDPAHRAAIRLYLAARCYNGLLRVNSKGKDNVPVGDIVRPCYPDEGDIAAFAKVAASWEIECADFEPSVDRAGEGSILWADPPYAGGKEMFTGYTAAGFDWADQARLADALARARDRGVVVLHTNSDHEGVRDLYSARGFTIIPTAELRAVNRDAKGRKRAACLLVVSHEEVVG